MVIHRDTAHFKLILLDNKPKLKVDMDDQGKGNEKNGGSFVICYACITALSSI